MRQPSLWATAAALAAVLLGVTSPVHADSVSTGNTTSSMELSTASASPGETVTFTLTLTNDTAAPVTAAHTLTASDPIFSPTDSLACETLAGPWAGVCVVQPPGRTFQVNHGFGSSPKIPAHSTARVRITTTVAANAAPGVHTLTPTGNVGGAGGAFSPASVPFRVLEPADLAVGLTARADGANSSVTYTQTTTNTGPGTLATGTVTTTLPDRTTSVTGLPAHCAYDAAAKAVACTAVDLAAGATARSTFTAHLDLLSLGRLSAVATRTHSSPIDPDPGNDTAGADCSAGTGLTVRC
ncbi:hypothetical protein ACN20G_35230 (plasmid) [Streptomyces sp. BI20]|uniref:hypothetical protein n=1 Tax=Streptomyces sp. BI20 TaxID=3403460 RepID=UPI003C73FDD0